ncbi:hypothetical protein [Flavihumibacter fluvii]|uniref:hypothetical protein n=1 Tax=Flavihumibacter fluvii TaxID=2838157 RepID=UPI001BDDE466|nr:hypothetical protein [Flavihumibacter fluvii]ULQ54280.1 hypothetical protein KJS93_08110 [Flavihumibacter fluvii]
MRALLPAFICILAFSACQRENAVVNANTDWPCGYVENLDSVTLHSRLLGEWQLKKQSTPTGQVIIPEDTILVQFRSPAAYKVTRNGELLSEGSWTLVSDGQSMINNQPVTMWRLSQTAAAEYLGGYVFVCGSELALVASFYDGMDQRYERK